MSRSKTSTESNNINATILLNISDYIKLSKERLTAVRWGNLLFDKCCFCHATFFS